MARRPTPTITITATTIPTITGTASTRTSTSAAAAERPCARPSSPLARLRQAGVSAQLDEIRVRFHEGTHVEPEIGGVSEAHERRLAVSELHERAGLVVERLGWLEGELLLALEGRERLVRSSESEQRHAALHHQRAVVRFAAQALLGQDQEAPPVLVIGAGRE